MPKLTIYTDGGCQPNPGPGGWGAVILAPGESPRELSGGEADSTNNRMELSAAIGALSSLAEPSEVALVTDSTYVKKGITEWIVGWRRRGWKTASKQPVKNRDLWQALDRAVKRHRVEWRWVRGHTGDRWNERAHDLAAAAIDRPDRPELPLEDDGAIHLFLGIAWSGKLRTGAWGAVLSHEDHQKEIAGTVRVPTSNAVHIHSAEQALATLKRPLPIRIYTVSDYLRDGATKWARGWQSRGWKTREGKPVANRGAWLDLLDRLRGLQVTWHVVSGDDAPAALERARELAREALKEEAEA